MNLHCTLLKAFYTYNMINVQWLQICTYFSNSQPHMIRTSWSKLLATVVTLLVSQPPVSICMWQKPNTQTVVSHHPQLVYMKPLFHVLWHSDSVMTRRPVSFSSAWCYSSQSGWEHSCTRQVLFHTLFYTFLCGFFFCSRSDITA